MLISESVGLLPLSDLSCRYFKFIYKEIELEISSVKFRNIFTLPSSMDAVDMKSICIFENLFSGVFEQKGSWCCAFRALMKSDG